MTYSNSEIYKKLVDLGIALSAERDHNRLIEQILIGAQEITNADGGTIYLVNEDGDALDFAIMRNHSLNLAAGGSTDISINLPAIPLYNKDGKENHSHIAASIYHLRNISSIEDAYLAQDYDFQGTKAFDQKNGYRSKSFLTVPLRNSKGEVKAILQLINAQDDMGHVIAFPPTLHEVIEALASQAAIAIENKTLIQAQQKLWDALIQMLASSIDDKSPYTGRHCERVPLLTKMIAEAASEANHGIFKEFSLSNDEQYALHVAAWLHDCGKITTPEYIVDKATKLETIYNRIHEIRSRFEILYRDAKIDYLKGKIAGDDEKMLSQNLKQRQAELQDQFQFLASANLGGEDMCDNDIARIKQIAAQEWVRHFDRGLGISYEEAEHLNNTNPNHSKTLPKTENLLMDNLDHIQDGFSQGEIYNLTQKKGTLNPQERQIINDHIVATQRMLSQLPFPHHLRNVPEYAGGHHEKMDGTGYPNGLKGEDMSIPARIMAIADIFEALTAGDRPYKKAKKLSQSLGILKNMALNGHIDPDIYDLFLTKNIWLDYANAHLTPDQIDNINANDYRLT